MLVQFAEKAGRIDLARAGLVMSYNAVEWFEWLPKQDAARLHEVSMADVVTQGNGEPLVLEKLTLCTADAHRCTLLDAPSALHNLYAAAWTVDAASDASGKRIRQVRKVSVCHGSSPLGA